MFFFIAEGQHQQTCSQLTFFTPSFSDCRDHCWRCWQWLLGAVTLCKHATMRTCEHACASRVQKPLLTLSTPYSATLCTPHLVLRSSDKKKNDFPDGGASAVGADPLRGAKGGRRCATNGGLRQHEHLDIQLWQLGVDRHIFALSALGNSRVHVRLVRSGRT
jgi:hypothetical protein